MNKYKIINEVALKVTVTGLSTTKKKTQNLVSCIGTGSVYRGKITVIKSSISWNENSFERSQRPPLKESFSEASAQKEVSKGSPLKSQCSCGPGSGSNPRPQHYSYVNDSAGMRDARLKGSWKLAPPFQRATETGQHLPGREFLQEFPGDHCVELRR